MKKIYILALTLFFFSVNYSQVLDSSFGVNGKLVTNTGQFSSEMFIHGGYIQPQGRIIVGSFDVDDEGYNPVSTISGFTSSGQIDSAFGYNGSIRTYANRPGGFLTHQSNNKIIAAGVASLDPFEVYRDVSVERFTTNGLRDSSFGINGVSVIDRGFGAYQQVFCTIVDAHDNIYVGGAVYKNANNASHLTVVRFKPNGLLDTSIFIRNSTKYEDQCYSLNVLADGSIIAGYLYNNFKSACIAKYKPNGARDLSFGVNGIVPFNTNYSGSYGNFLHTVVLSDGSVLSATGNSDKIWFYKVSSSGVPDRSFGMRGVVSTDDLINGFSTYSHNFSVDANNRILLPLQDFKIKRLLPNGQTDSSFGTNGYVSADLGNGLPGAFEIALTSGDSFFGIGDYTNFTSSEIVIAKYKNSAAFAAVNKNNVSAEMIAGKIKIFPNPVTDLLHITGLKDKSNIMIADTKGSVLIKTYTDQPALDLNVSRLITGTYYLMINNASQTIKFIKE